MDVPQNELTRMGQKKKTGPFSKGEADKKNEEEIKQIKKVLLQKKIIKIIKSFGECDTE